jgi:ABC-type ATPase with predicted acetyltransferase domain
MATFSISRHIQWQGAMTDRVIDVCRMFGLTAERLTDRRRDHVCRLDINDGDIVYITGASGTGKSILLEALQNCIPASERINLAQINLPSDKTLIDCVQGDLLMSLRFLSIAGLSDCFCILNQPSRLSAGQQYRFRLAMALAAQKPYVFADEFCSGLDRITALVVSQRLRAFATRTGTTFILASSHKDIMLDLAPDVLVMRDFTSSPQVTYKRRRM